MIYDLIAPVYDEINKDIDYSEWADFIEDRIKTEYWESEPANLILDLGCGTGKMTLELARRGYDMTGVDSSFEMLDIARSAAEEAGMAEKVLWLMQDMTEFELYGTVEVAVSCLDCINHITEREELLQCLRLVHNYLSPGGLFIFDINGKGKFERLYSDNTYVFETENSVLVWQNAYDADEGLSEFYITLFSEGEDGRYDREDEVECERVYTIREINDMLSSVGLLPLGAYSDFKLTPATDDDERIYFVARCIKENQ